MSEHDSLLAEAEQAAGAGDLHAAEQLLRRALAQQEARLGATHPDVANTVNNLAVVCERLGKLDDAEQGYRRAHAIAVAALPPRHPFVATSLKNLVEFCAARDIPLWTPPTAEAGEDHAEAPAPVTAREPAGPAPVMPSEPAIAGPELSAERAPRAAGAGAFALRPSRVAAAVAAVVATPVVLLLASGGWSGASDARPAAQESRPVSVSGARASAPAAAPSAPSPGPVPQPVAPPGGPDRTRAAADARPAANAPSNVDAVVLTAAVCSSLERRGSPDWACTPVAGTAKAGTFTFYTRVRVPSRTTVEHRWYHGDRLHQTIRLNVEAGGENGYRTYSRATVAPDRAGEWRVEVRTADGTVLQDARFSVR